METEEILEKSYVEREREKFRLYVESDEYKKKISERLKITASTQGDAVKKQFAMHLCRDPINGPVFFIQNFGWTYDPRTEHSLPGIQTGGNLPFILFPYQEDFIRTLAESIRNGKDLYVDKSRDMGATWCLIWVYVWFWMFSDTFSGHLGSRKEELVDNKTKDSLMGIIDYALKSLPKWMLPANFDPKKHRLHLKLTNPENHNLITGESMNSDFSRQSRKSVVAFDEFAFWEYGKNAWDSAGDTSPCRIAVTTPNGRNHAALLRESGIKVVSLHWSKHPLKDQSWYDYQRQRRTDEEIAQELDISYQKSQEGRVYPEWDLVPYGVFPYDPQLPLFVSWDFGKTDDTALIWWQSELNGQYRIVDCYWNNGKLIDFYVPFVTGIIPSDTHLYSRKDLAVIEEHKFWPKGTHFGDPAGRFSNQVSNKTVLDVLKLNGIIVNFREEAKDFQTRKTALKLLLRSLSVNDNERTKYLGICIANASYPNVRDKGADFVKSVQPRHDFTSHFRSSAEYFAVNIGRMNLNTRRVQDKFAPKETAGSRFRLPGQRRRGVHY